MKRSKRIKPQRLCKGINHYYSEIDQLEGMHTDEPEYEVNNDIYLLKTVHVKVCDMLNNKLIFFICSRHVKYRRNGQRQRSE